MEINLNGQIREVNEALTLAELIESLELSGKRLAIEVNEDLVTRSLFETHQLQPNDQVEIVQAIGGG